LVSLQVNSLLLLRLKLLLIIALGLALEFPWQSKGSAPTQCDKTKLSLGLPVLG
jgi:hypothetical protein